MRFSFAHLAVCFVAVTLAACSGGTQIAPGVVAVTNPDQPVAPGTIKFTLTNPDKEKWTARIRQGAPDGSVRYGFTCAVLACPEPAEVIVTNRRSPTARPDPKALEKLAKESIPKLTQARNLELQVRTDNKGKAETLSSNVVKVNDYPAILTETKVTINNSSRYTAAATVFAGRVLVNISANAGNRATAKQAVEEFSRSFKVEEGPAL
ncbi:MAG: hypothetical protein ACRCWF_16710 [Beijerinckiaceae bacterium]